MIPLFELRGPPFWGWIDRRDSDSSCKPSSDFLSEFYTCTATLIAVIVLYDFHPEGMGGLEGKENGEVLPGGGWLVGPCSADATHWDLQ